MGLKDLYIRTEYNSIEEDVVREFLIPALRDSVKYDRAAGYFSSSGLAKQTVGISGLVDKGGHIRLITSPHISIEDAAAISEGYQQRDKLLKNNILLELQEPQNKFEAERLNYLANLIASGILDIKIAVLKTETGIFHDKFGVIYDDCGDSVAFRGSMNESENGFYHNFDTIDVYKSWEEPGRIISKQSMFDQLWSGDENSEVITLDFPEINDAIIEKYKTNDSLDQTIDIRQFGPITKTSKNWMIKIPKGIELHDYQHEAIAEWEKRAYKGIFDMATGAGKTYTALGALERFERVHGNIGAIVVCPFVHLVDQWAEDVREWGAEPIIAHSQAGDWRKTLIHSYKRFRDNNRSFICLVTNATFRDDTFQQVLCDVPTDSNAVIVVDEVHNFGADSLASKLPLNFKNRLGLSATVERHMDLEGTKKLFDYFGTRCIEYPIERAIREGALVQYEYYPIIVSLSDEELEEYEKLTKQISKYILQKGKKTTVSETGQQLLFKRTRLVAGAESKIEGLKEALEPYKEEKHILIYCGATRGLEEYKGQKERQIDRVERMVAKDLRMTTHQFTSEEDAKTRELLKTGFAEGHYQVLTAIKCLDEGVNIPNIQTAFILASSRNPKEFIQRRGRVLRKAKGKDRAIIFDFVTLPRPLSSVSSGDYNSDKGLVIGEMARIFEFGRYAINSRIADNVLENIQDVYGICINYEDLADLMEEENGEDRD